jgi:hypothetical protein
MSDQTKTTERNIQVPRNPFIDISYPKQTLLSCSQVVNFVANANPEEVDAPPEAEMGRYRILLAVEDALRYESERRWPVRPTPRRCKVRYRSKGDIRGVRTVGA